MMTQRILHSRTVTAAVVAAGFTMAVSRFAGVPTATAMWRSAVVFILGGVSQAAIADMFRTLSAVPHRR